DLTASGQDGVVSPPRDVKVTRYGVSPDGAPDVTARDVKALPRGTAMTIVDNASGAAVEVQTKLLGRHAVGHVLAGVAVGLALGARLEQMAGSIADMEPVEHRLQIIDGAGGVTVIDDAYNSNPEGAAEALSVLRSISGGKKIVITPGMVELGPEQFSANVRFGRQAAEAADVVIVVAEVNREAILKGAAEAKGGGELIAVDSLDQATGRLAGLVTAGDVVLFENDLPDQYER
ncbi:MAG: UDP-N-acetylmuramoyl-tripeptide--D-alanyl-D-alanine ligase, partial [Actinomycetota bacterium]|nr:UDP-N-acetylmuramoyl-tripeptide--D-alanyl-D-alanine ligase [Actinomycetota bacterium]